MRQPVHMVRPRNLANRFAVSIILLGKFWRPAIASAMGEPATAAPARRLAPQFPRMRHLTVDSQSRSLIETQPEGESKGSIILTRGFPTVYSGPTSGGPIPGGVKRKLFRRHRQSTERPLSPIQDHSRAVVPWHFLPILSLAPLSAYSVEDNN